MKLACLRCKQRKTKCDRVEPTCHQCVLAKADCHYLERRKRPRLSQPTVDILKERLELLEKQVTSGHHELSTVQEAMERDENVSADSTPHQSPTDSASALAEEDGQESWIYHMATDARRNFEASTQSQAPTPTPQIDSAMSTLNEALDDLGKLKIRSFAETIDDLNNLKYEECLACINSFEKLVKACVVPEVFVDTIDWNMFRSLPTILDSPYISIEPAMRVLYWNAMHYGLEHLHGSGVKMAQAAYIKVIESVPAWLNNATGTDLDCQVATISTWTAINNLDFQLSYKFHCKACQFLRMNGIDRLDIEPAKSHEEESRRELMRYFYWQIQSTDTLYRLFFKKPGLLRWSPKKVKLPSVISPRYTRPKAAQVAITAVWAQYASMTAEMLNFVDDCAKKGGEKNLRTIVDDFCLELEEIIADWKLLSIMREDALPMNIRFLMADHVMTMYSNIIGIQRQVRSQSQDHTVDPLSLRAARKAVDIILHFFCGLTAQGHAEAPTLFILCGFISFYPFCAIFSLYEHILACPDPSECDADLKNLEQLAATMEEASTVRKDFIPLSKTIQALNRVSKTIQEERRTRKDAQARPPTNSSDPYGKAPSTSSTNPFQQMHDEHGINLATGTISPSQGTADAPLFDSLGSGLPFLQEYPSNGEFQAYGFVRAVENDFIGRNWHNDWWDVDMGGTSTSDTQPTTEFNLPTPNT